MTGEQTAQLQNETIAAIESVLREDAVSRRILGFLLQNEAAMDTARGIAAWWVRCDEVAVQTALDRLMACGAVSAHTMTSGTLYGLTRNSEVRASLRGRQANLLGESSER
jgi:hypothetical protein